MVVFAFIVVGIFCAAAIWLQLKVDDWTYARAEEAAQALERQKYRAVDFGGTARAPPPARPTAAPAKVAADLAPMTPQPVSPALARATADGRPAWAPVADQGLVGLVCVLGLVAWIWFLGVRHGGDDAGAPEAVAEVLELNGFAAPKVKRQWLATHCRFNSYAYRWSGMGAEGRACANWKDGEIRVKIDKTWGPLPRPLPGAPSL